MSHHSFMEEAEAGFRHRNDADQDKVWGVLFGQAVGDALGLGTEFLTYEQVRQYYPNGLTDYNQIVQDAHCGRWEKGSWTDDTDMMLCIARALIERRAVDVRAIAREFKHWASGMPMGIGRSTYNVLMLGDYVAKPYECAQAVWELSKRQNAPNGAVMRTAVVGLLPRHVEQHAVDICRLTHADPRCQGSCAIVAHIVHALVYEGRTPPLSELIAIGQAYSDEIERYLTWASAATRIRALQLDDPDDPDALGYTLKTMAAAVWCLYHVASFEQGLLDVVNTGGDADTNAAVACSMLGARYGYRGIPERYVSGLVGKDRLMQTGRQLLNVLPQID